MSLHPLVQTSYSSTSNEEENEEKQETRSDTQVATYFDEKIGIPDQETVSPCY